MTRENKLAIVIGFGLLLFVGILVSDHLSARNAQIANPQTEVARLEPARLPGGEPQQFGPGLPPADPMRPVSGTYGIDDGNLGGNPAGNLGVGLAGPNVPPPAMIETPAPKERTHTIAKGETLGDVAKRYYGKRSLGVKLAEFNKADSSRLKIGQVISVPDITVLDPAAAPAAPAETALVGQPVAPAPMPPATEQPKFGTVKVAEGDTLYRIAKRVYGDGSRWSEIAALNNLGDGKSLKPGRELKYALAR
jgi:nucleoid-associated protein YgaU